MIQYLVLFIIGLIESFGLGLNTKFLQKNKEIPCFFMSLFNQVIWYLMLRSVTENIENFILCSFYFVGYAFGDVVAIRFDKYLDKIARFRGFKLKKKNIKKRKK